ncbi:restriction endonuclease subunit S [Pseudomonas inefficax]
MSLPGTWVQTTVRAIVEDIQPGFAQKPGEEDEGTTPQIRTHNITPDGKISLVGIKHITASLKESDRYSLSIGDVVFNNTNSEDWVGKTAVFDQEGKYVFSNHMTRLRVRRDLVCPDYLAAYLQQLWSMGYAKTRAKRWVSQAGIESETLASFKVPLPTLLEQQRIVDILRQAEVVDNAKKSISDQVDQLIRTAYWEHFGAWFTADGLVDPVRIGDYVADSQYGISEAMGETGTHAVLRMNSVTTSGWLELSDLKYASLSKKDINSTELQDGDLLFNRTNSKELVGKCAVWRPVEGAYSFASYLVRLRLKQGMLPEYLWATLNSAYGKYRLFNSAKQAVSMANVSPTALGRITVPLPPLPLQEKFANFVREIERIRAKMLGKLRLYSELQGIISQRALIGELTSEWRELHVEQIVEAGKVRNALLRSNGAKVALTGTVKTNIVAQADIAVRPARQWLLDELSEFQRRVLKGFNGYELHPVFTEDTSDFAGFCDSDAVRDALGGLEWSPNQVGRALGVLADLGLIAQVSILRRDVATNSDTFHKAFRPLKEEERTRLEDISALKRMSRFGDEADVSYHFRAYLDHETSARAGAYEMFQVTQLEDNYGHSRTDWIDQGRHYADLNALRDDLANRLGVAPSLVTVEEIA